MNATPAPADRRFEQLRSLTQLSRALTYASAAEDVVRLATTRAAEMLDARNAILMLSGADGVLRVRATHGIAAEKVESVCDRLDESLIRRLQEVLDAPLRDAFLGVPLVAGGSVIGLLAVVRRSEAPISEDEEWLLSAIADQAAVALEMVRLEEEVRRIEQAEASERLFADSTAGTTQALATLSHDLRSPLNAIDSYAELMEMELMGPVADRQREALGRIRMSGRHLLAVLENVLEMTRITAGVVRIHRDTVAMSQVVDEAVLMLSPGASSKGIKIEVGSGEAPVVAADPDRFRQALMNVLGNAIKYTPTGGTVKVQVNVRDGDGRRLGVVRVIDTGPGIPADKLQSIFQPYYRIHNGDVSGPEGTGLGLAIARELVRKMEGDIEVESELGGGATFTLTLPTAEPEIIEKVGSSTA